MDLDSFKKALSRTDIHEGGYSNNPLDPGKETMFGITSRVARKWGYKGEMRFLPRETADEIYLNEYWLAASCDKLPFPLAYQVFDGAVNSGPPQAIKWLQRVLGVKEDGILGPITLAAIHPPDVIRLSLRYIAERGEFQASLPTWPSFGKGWARRNYANLKHLSEDTLEFEGTLV